MSESTKIQWCDSTHNFWRGCKPVSAGCANCYAKTRPDRFGEKFSERTRIKSFYAPLLWNKRPWVCNETGVCVSEKGKIETLDGKRFTFHRRRAFSLSLGDWLDPEVPIEWLADMLDVVRCCDQLEWILCTKRPELFSLRINHAIPSMGCGATWAAGWIHGDYPENITILASVEDQQTADERIPHLLKIPAARRGLSVEPLLGPVDLGFFAKTWRANWIIVGGESGPKARPCNVDWIRGVLQQCKAAQVPCFVKQLGRNPCCQEFYCNGHSGPHQCGIENIKHPKGGDPAEWPEDLRVREFPQSI